MVLIVNPEDEVPVTTPLQGGRIRQRRDVLSQPIRWLHLRALELEPLGLMSLRAKAIEELDPGVMLHSGTAFGHAHQVVGVRRLYPTRPRFDGEGESISVYAAHR